MSPKERLGHFPSKDDILAFIRDYRGKVTKREIARAFGIKGPEKIQLKKILRELTEDGLLAKDQSRALRPADRLPNVQIIEYAGTDKDGDPMARPVNWKGDGDVPTIYINEKKGRRGSAMGTGDRALARLIPIKDEPPVYRAEIIKMLHAAPSAILGVYQGSNEGGRILPTDKKNRDEYWVDRDDIAGAQDGELVAAEPVKSRSRSGGPKRARIKERYGDVASAKSISLIAIHAHDIPNKFPERVLRAADEAKPVALGKRTDLRDIALITIDPADARDHDDAIWAEADTDSENEGGWHVIVAIADVAHYVQPNTSLDREAVKRGNSCYFPDRVVPMLPEALSNDLCSLRPHEDRACLATHMWIDKQGKLLKHKFVRGIMRSHARLIYEQVQAAYDGQTDDITEHLVEPVLNPLYDAFKILDTARQKRGALEIDLPERKPIIDDKGQVTNIVKRDRLDSHKLVEEFMILANVATAEALESKNSECVYRVHDKPDPTKIEAAGDFVSQLGYSITKGQTMTPSLMNGIIKKSVGSDEHDLINTLVLRCQCRAIYSPTNIGHFGLALDRYAHFTSPIRRYADLIVHRALVKAFNLGEGPLSEEEIARIDEISNHISETERHSMVAERDATDRFTALYLSENIGNEFAGRINSVTNFGLFVTLDESGADGIVPMRSLPDDYYIHDEDQHALIGERHGRVYRLSAPVTISLVEADPLKGSMVFKVLNKDGADIPGFKKKPLKRQQRNGPRRSGKNRKDGKAPHFKRNKKKNIKKKSST